MIHTLACMEAEEKFLSLQTGYSRRWLKHCRTETVDGKIVPGCDGWGGKSTYDRDTGYDFDECLKCLGQCKCPRCGHKIVCEDYYGTMFMVEVPRYGGKPLTISPDCPWCGFVTGYTDGKPNCFECSCPDSYTGEKYWNEGLM